MLLTVANVNIAEKQASKLKELTEGAKANQQRTDGLLLEIRSKVDAGRSVMAEWKAMLIRVTESLAWIQKACIDFKVTMRNLMSINDATYKAVIAIQSGLPSPLERTLFEEPFILEDAIGRVAPVHLQFINSWDALQAVLERRFHGIQGHEKIEGNEYVLQDHATGRDIIRSQPWTGSFLPGQRINMSMIFQRESSKVEDSTAVPCPRCGFRSIGPQDRDTQCSGCGFWFRRIIDQRGSSRVEDSTAVSCPGCGLTSIGPQDRDTQCSGCGLWFRRIIEMEEVDAQHERKEGQSCDCSTEQMSSGLPSPPRMHPSSRKRKRESDQTVNLNQFKRIRLITKAVRSLNTEAGTRPVFNMDLRDLFSDEETAARPLNAYGGHTVVTYGGTAPIGEPTSSQAQAYYYYK
jgi:ribosomal protein L37E